MNILSKRVDIDSVSNHQSFIYKPSSTMFLGSSLFSILFAFFIQQQFETIPDQKSFTSLLVEFFLLMVAIISELFFGSVILRYFYPQKILITEESIYLPAYLYISNQLVEFRFDRILEVKNVKNVNNDWQIIGLKSESGHHVIHLNNLNNTDLKNVLDILMVKLGRLSDFKGEYTFYSIRVSGIREALAKAIIIFLSGLILFSATFKYNDRQLEFSLFFLSSIPIVSSIFFLIFKNCKNWSKLTTLEIVGILCLILQQSYCLSSGISYLNQKGDISKPSIEIASLTRSHSDEERKNFKQKCFLVNSAYLKDTANILCTDSNPNIDETSLVEVEYKSGNFGQRWIASLELINGQTKTKAEFDQ